MFRLKSASVKINPHLPAPFDWFGHTVSSIGDLNGDGIKDLAVGAIRDVENGIASGSLYILFLDNDASVKSFNKISAHTPGIGTELADGDKFGHTVSPIGDLDGDGVTDLVVGTETNDVEQSAVFILFMNADGTLKDFQKISDTEGGFDAELEVGDHFGVSAHGIGDLDLDGNPDIVVGTDFDDDGGLDIGAAYILFLNSDGTVKSHLKISDTKGGFAASLDEKDSFGHRLVSIDDFDNDGITDLLVSAFLDDDGGINRGAIYLMFLNDPSGFDTIAVLCSPPVSGDWTITSSCTLSSNAVAPGNVIVQNNSVLTIPSGLTLDIDFVNNFLRIEFPSGVLIKAGGSLT